MTGWLHFHFHFHALEKEMATHSSVLAWRIPGTGEPGGLLSMWSHRVGHDWRDLAAAAGKPDMLQPWGGHKESDTTEWLTTIYCKLGNIIRCYFAYSSTLTGKHPRNHKFHYLEKILKIIYSKILILPKEFELKQ